MKLEELARQSSDAVRVSVAHLDLPPIGDGRPSRSWTPVLVGAGLTAAVVAGLAFVVSNRFSGEATPADQVPDVVEVPRLGLPDDLGWTVVAAGSHDELFSPGGVEQPTFAYFGDAGDDPFGERDLLVASYRGDDEIAGSEGDAVAVRGTTGTITSGVDQGLPGDATALEWREEYDGGRAEVIFVSRSFGADELVAIADAASFDPVTARLTPAADLGLTELLVSSGTPFDGARGSGEGYMVSYQRGDGADFVTVNASRGDLGREVLGMRWWTSAIEEVSVGGQPGVLLDLSEAFGGDTGGLTGHSVIWTVRPGVVGTLSSYGRDDSLDIVELAASTVELDEETWDRYVAASRDQSAGVEEFDDVFGRSEGTVGDSEYVWVLGLQGENLCFNVQSGSGGYGTCQERISIEAPAGSARTIDSSFGDEFAHVLIAADPVVGDVVEVEGRYTIERVDADGIAWYVAIGDRDIRPTFDVIVDGAVVTTLEAAVEATAEGAMPTTDAVRELGLDSMEPLFASFDDPELIWWFGEHEGRACVVTDGAAAEATCVAPDDVMVFPTVSLPDGARTIVVLRDAPTCATARVAVEDLQAISEVATDEHVYSFWMVPRKPAGMFVELTGDGARQTFPLPQPGDTASWPGDTCG